MLQKKVIIFIFSLLFFYSFLTGVFCADKAASPDKEKLPREEVQVRTMCMLGEKVENFPFYVYQDGKSGGNKFFPTGTMGDFNSRQIDPYCNEFPHSGSSCIKITYESKAYQDYGWGGLYWQYPPNNWGDTDKAYDLSLATKLTFWARGKYGGEVINKFQVGGITGKYHDSGVISVGPITLRKEWRKYTFDLTRMDSSIIFSEEDRGCWPFMNPLSRIMGGFCWATSLVVNNNKGITFYLDEIKFEKD